uniref:Chemokine (C-C motif) ligand 34b, duplicate 4 n=1 Tax=Latimeria chalumnae TaxID=7897 RepID=H3AKD3_LATCH
CHPITPLYLSLQLVRVVSASVRHPSKVTTNCCKSISKSKVPYPILKFRVHSALGPCKRAVIFYTSDVGPICSDPNARWVKEKVRELKRKMNKEKT